MSRFAALTFTNNVLAEQRQYDSPPWVANMAGEVGPAETLGEAERAFIAERDGFYIATVTETGWPYVQYRGGPAGFLKTLDERTLGFADFRGNRQLISMGNLRGNARAALILMDYAARARLKILATVRVVDARDEPELVRRLEVPVYKARVERGLLLTVEGFDWNCPQHITPRFTLDEINAGVAPLRAELERARAEIQDLRSRLGLPAPPDSPPAEPGA